MNNLPSTDTKNILEAVAVQTDNINTLLGVVTTISTDVSTLSTELGKVRTTINEQGSRITEIEEKLKNGEVTTAQKKQIKKAATRRVFQLLGLHPNKKEWSLETKTYAKKYLSLFYGRCYSEVSKLGHLASPYETTAQKDYDYAIQDIEAWIPSQGVDGLKREADENALARKIAQEMGY